MPTNPTDVMARRIGAYVIDALIGVVIGFIVFFATADKVPQSTSGKSGFNIDLGDSHYHSGGGLVFLVWGVYTLVVFVAVTGTTGATPGKALTGIRVVDVAGNPPGIGRAIVRWLLLIVDNFAFFLVGLITSLSSKSHQRVGDMAAKTYVVGKDWMGQPLPLGGHLPPMQQQPPPPPPIAAAP